MRLSPSHKGSAATWRHQPKPLSHSLTCSAQVCNAREPRKQVLEMIESESRALAQAEATPSTPKSETDVEIAPLVQNLGTTSSAEIEKMIGELQEARDFLQAEGERVQREAEHYITLSQM